MWLVPPLHVVSVIDIAVRNECCGAECRATWSVRYGAERGYSRVNILISRYQVDILFAQVQFLGLRKGESLCFLGFCRCRCGTGGKRGFV